MVGERRGRAEAGSYRHVIADDDEDEGEVDKTALT